MEISSAKSTFGTTRCQIRVFMALKHSTRSIVETTGRDDSRSYPATYGLFVVSCRRLREGTSVPDELVATDRFELVILSRSWFLLFVCA